MDGRPSPATPPARVSDTERDRALALLRDQVAQGRLSHDTFEYRVDQVLRARSGAELEEIARDLPDTSRVVSRLTGLVARVSTVTARLESAWRTPRLPRFTLPPDGLARVLVGRAASCQFVLTDQTVSRVHAEICRDGPGEWTIRDLNSMNGTVLNGRRLLGSARVRPGDEVRFGDAAFVTASP